MDIVTREQNIANSQKKLRKACYERRSFEKTTQQQQQKQQQQQQQQILNIKTKY